MVKLPAMSFGTYTWKYNPKTLQVTQRRALKEWKLPLAASMVQDLGQTKRVVTGEGELFGEDCLNQFQFLSRLCAEGGERLLTVPGIDTFPAFFSSLTVIGEARPDLIRYRFEFWESPSGLLTGKTRTGRGYHVVEEGQTLWQIAALYNTNASALMKLNPELKRPDQLTPGQKVWLR